MRDFGALRSLQELFQSGGWLEDCLRFENQPAPYTGLPGLRARNAEKVSKVSPGAGAPKSLKKVSRKSGKSSESLRKVQGKTKGQQLKGKIVS